MKATFNTLAVLIFVVCIGQIITSCKGDKGLEGPQGAQGMPGPAGSTILSGNGAPAQNTGNTGDFYLDLGGSKMYGPKSASGWGNGISLKGANGEKGATGATGAKGSNGANGSKILSGNGAPAASLGATGDYYLDKTSYSLYGPKTSNGWATALNLQGPAGTANVLYSGWNYAKNFRDSTVDNSVLKLADLLAPELSNDILNGGSLQVFFNFGTGVFPLPYTSFAGAKVSTVSYLPRLKHFIITRFTADNSGSLGFSPLLQYRYVIIPGGVRLTASSHINLGDYQAVKNYFHIPD